MWRVIIKPYKPKIVFSINILFDKTCRVIDA
jgi:hypothetical protein